jgi:hypothetical protein
MMICKFESASLYFSTLLINLDVRLFAEAAGWVQVLNVGDAFQIC